MRRLGLGEWFDVYIVWELEIQYNFYKLQKKIGRKIECYNQLDNDGFKDPYLKMDGAGTNLGYYTVM